MEGSSAPGEGAGGRLPSGANGPIAARVVSRDTASLAGEPFDALLLGAGTWLPSVTARICMSELKVGSTDRYLWQSRKLIGFRFDEPARWWPAVYRECRIACPMVNARITAADVAEFRQAQDFDLGIASGFGNFDLCYLKLRRNLLATLREAPARADWWIEAQRRAKRTFRIGESFADLRDAALAPGGIDEMRRPLPADAGEPLPCFCPD